MAGVEGAPLTALGVGPPLECVGEGLVPTDRGAVLLPGAVPGVGPGWVPPRVQAGEGGCGGGGEGAGAGFAALLAQPSAEGEAVLSGVFVRGEVAVSGGVGACVVESGADGVGACGRGGSFAYGSVGRDAEGGQEVLLAGVEMLPGLLLDTGPAAQASGRFVVGTPPALVARRRW